MRTLACLALALAAAACGSKKAAATGDVNKDTTAFMLAFADAVVSGGDDCDKIAANLEALQPQAAAVREELIAAKKTLSDIPPDASFADKMKAMKDPAILDKCEKTSPRTSKALDQTILVVAPLGGDSAFADAFGAAFAPTSK